MLAPPDTFPIIIDYTTRLSLLHVLSKKMLKEKKQKEAAIFSSIFPQKSFPRGLVEIRNFFYNSFKEYT